MLKNELLLPENIKIYLTAKEIGKKIYYCEEIDSTNNKAKVLGKNPAENGTVVVSESQSNGRGRLERSWQSPFGKGIWASVILQPAFKESEAAKFTLVAAVAAVGAIKEAAGVCCSIKWPNDILWHERKIAGILTEMSRLADGGYYLVIGVGINVNIEQSQLGESIRDSASSLLIASGKKINRAQLLASFLNHLEQLYCLVTEKGFSPILKEWRKMSSTLGQLVEVTGQKEPFTGVAVDIDDDGALLVKTSAKTEKILAGDVSVRRKL